MVYLIEGARDVYRDYRNVVSFFEGFPTLVEDASDCVVD